MSQPTPAEVRAELERVLVSRCFAQAGRASDFLRFVVDATLAGSPLKGYTIAVEVFGRPPDFDPQADPLVRVEAGRLRTRLAEYYETEGAGNPVRIGLPRGGYSATWQYAAAAVEEPPARAQGPDTGRRPVRDRWLTLACALTLVALLGVALWQARELERMDAALAQRESAAPAAPAAAPRLAVVPLENLSSGHAHMTTLAAGLTEEIMLALGGRDLIVVAGPPRAAARGLYVLSGTIRGEEDAEHIRILLRLADASTGAQIWSRAYDRPHEIENQPDLQAAVARDVAAIAAPYGPIFEAELAREERSAGDLVLRDCEARYFDYRRTLAVAPFRRALDCYQLLSVREPEQGAVWAGLAMLYLDDYGFRHSTTPTLAASYTLAREATERALALDHRALLANMALARVQFFDGHTQELARTVERVLRREPDSAEARSYFGAMLALAGDPRGLALVDEALRMSPNQPSLVHMAYVSDHLRHERCREALAAAERIEMPQWFVSHMAVAAAAGLCGDSRLAERARWRLLQLYPNFEAEAYDLFDQWQNDAALQAALDKGLTAAGLNLAARERQRQAN